MTSLSVTKNRIYNSHFQVVPVPVNYQSVLGGVQAIPDRIIFEPAFPVSQTTVTMTTIIYYYHLILFLVFYFYCSTLHQKHVHKTCKTGFTDFKHHKFKFLQSV